MKNDRLCTSLVMRAWGDLPLSHLASLVIKYILRGEEKVVMEFRFRILCLCYHPNNNEDWYVSTYNQFLKKHLKEFNNIMTFGLYIYIELNNDQLANWKNTCYAWMKILKID